MQDIFHFSLFTFSLTLGIIEASSILHSPAFTFLLFYFLYTLSEECGIGEEYRGCILLYRVTEFAGVQFHSMLFSSSDFFQSS